MTTNQAQRAPLETRQWLPRLIRGSRPKFWLYTAGPFLLGSFAGLPPPRNLLTASFWLPFLYFLVPANAYLYGINDLFDLETDRLNARSDELKGEAVLTGRSLTVQRIVVCAILILDILILALLPDTPARIGYALFVALCTLYSAPPVRFKARPFLDSYSNVLYVIPGFLGYYLAAGGWPPLTIIGAGALWAAGMHAYSALPDIEPDSRAGIATVATALGERRGLLFVMFNWIGFAALIIVALGAYGLPTLLYPLMPLALYLNPRWSVARAYRWFPFVNAGFGFLAFVLIAIR
jgi:4-hydroxybenzoate polyprenyltransferase